ncbi:SH3 domain-containing protein 19-like [Diorhabda sublineata]|uniref:SH3 domain-containing protein 19-like n=1 Tax=Diorhabda sublineata TaxID=1163346 RepID=UPI0024E11870|nr:SH3 domain-containing protein 19-like [Diorhabda sublineata]
MSSITRTMNVEPKTKKKPPRPPPPNWSKYRSKSTYNLFENLIEWTPPNSPKIEKKIGGSVSSSFNSSNSSLASSKNSIECDIPIFNNLWPTSRSNIHNKNTSDVPSTHANTKPINIPSNHSYASPSTLGPTIIRSIQKKNMCKESIKMSPPSIPMPSIPPPDPPKDIQYDDIPYGIALYDFQSKEPNDLPFQVNDIILLTRKINDDWFYGKTGEREGIFPANFIDVIVPLSENDKTAMALYEFQAQIDGDLSLKPGQLVNVTKKINDDWLYGESNGKFGQFPSNFVDKVPAL